MASYGILGGTFDPVHQGHLMLACEALSQLSLDAVYFVPNGQPPHKDARAHCPGEHRFRMVQLAVEGQPHFVPLRLEVDKAGPSYAVDTLRTIRKGLDPHDRLYFIIGTDAFAELDTWRDASQVVTICRFAVARRPGSHPEHWPAVCPRDNAVLLDVPQMEISSSEIRRRLEEHRAVCYMVPKQVFDYIADHHLYGA